MWGSMLLRLGVYLPPFAPRMVPLLLRKEARGGGKAATSYCFDSDEARRWTEPVWQLSDRPRHPFGSLTLLLGSNPTLAGHGGSVSRRDHNQAYRRPPTRCMGAQVRRNVQTYSQPLFGRGGLRERRFSQRSGLSPSISPPRLFRREREGGGFSTEKPPPSHLSHFQPHGVAYRE